jgi:twitching motility protein PilT
MRSVAVALVDSLLTAMVRADGDALVMHVGERPIVVSGARTIDLSNHGMNLGAMVGMLGQLLSHDAQVALKEFGAVEHELPAREDDHFSVVAARSGDDIWIEIRRRRETSQDTAAQVHAVPPHAREATAPRSDENSPAAEEQNPPSTTAEARSTTLPDVTPVDEVERADVADAEAIDAAPESAPAVSLAATTDHAAPELAEQEATQAQVASEAASTSPDGVEPATAPELATQYEPVHIGGDTPLVPAAAVGEQTPEPTERYVIEVEADSIAETMVVESVSAHAQAGDASEGQLAEPGPEPAKVEVELPGVEQTADREEAASSVEALAPAAMADATDEAASAEAEAQPVLASASASVQSVSALASGTSMDAPRHQAQPAGGPPPETAAPAPPPVNIASGPPIENGTSVSNAPVTRTVRIEVPARSASRAAAIDRLLRAADTAGASELFLVSQVRPYVRVGGNVRALQDEPQLGAADIDALISDVTPEPWRDAVRRGDPAEWLIEVADVGRVRCATFRDHRGPGANFHFAFLRAATADDLQLSAETRLLATEPDGLVLVSGLAGSDASAVVSAFVDLLNQQRADYIITLEPQVRVLHANRQALVSQREVGSDPARAAAAARAALREQPDVLVIESLGTSDLAQLAVEAASQERLVIASIEAASAPAAVQRFVELLPAEHRHHSREQLSRRFRGAVAQLVLRRAMGGRVAARELLTSTRAVSRLLLEGDLARLSDQLEASGATGLAPLTDTLVDYVRSGMVDVREAVRKAPDAGRLVDRLKASGADLSALERWS